MEGNKGLNHRQSRGEIHVRDERVQRLEEGDGVTSAMMSRGADVRVPLVCETERKKNNGARWVCSLRAGRRKEIGFCWAVAARARAGERKGLAGLGLSNFF